MSSSRRLWLDLLALGFLLAAMLFIARPSGAQDAPDLWEVYWRTRMAEAQERQAQALERQNQLWQLWQRPVPAFRAPPRHPSAVPQVPQGATWCVGEGPLRRCY